MKAVCTQSTRDYVPSCDKEAPVAEQTVFELRQLTPREEALLDNMLGSMREGSMDMRIGDQQLFALHMGLVGVRNFFDDKGNEIKIERTGKKLHGFVDPIKDEILAFIPREIRAELANEITSGSEISEDEAKN